MDRGKRDNHPQRRSPLKKGRDPASQQQERKYRVSRRKRGSRRRAAKGRILAGRRSTTRDFQQKQRLKVDIVPIKRERVEKKKTGGTIEENFVQPSSRKVVRPSE